MGKFIFLMLPVQSCTSAGRVLFSNVSYHLLHVSTVPLNLKAVEGSISCPTCTLVLLHKEEVMQTWV
jgi:hypothetical protein